MKENRNIFKTIGLMIMGGIAFLIGLIQIILFISASAPKRIPEPEVQIPKVIIPKEDPFSYEDKSFEDGDLSQKEHAEQNTLTAAQPKSGLSLRLKDDN